MKFTGSKTQHRIGIGIILLLGIYIFPWWITLTLGLVGFLFFHSYVELVFAGILLDVIYGASPTPDNIPQGIVFTLGALIIFFIGTIVKEQLRLHNIAYVE